MQLHLKILTANLRMFCQVSFGEIKKHKFLQYTSYFFMNAILNTNKISRNSMHYIEFFDWYT